MITRNERKRLERALQRLSATTHVPVATICEYVELDLVRIANDTVSIPTVRLSTLEKQCRELSNEGGELHRAILAKEAALAQLSANIDRARVSLMERQERLIVRQNDLAALRSQREAADEELRKVNRAVADVRFARIRARADPDREAPKLVVRIALMIFTLIGIAIALFLIFHRLH